MIFFSRISGRASTTHVTTEKAFSLPSWPFFHSRWVKPLLAHSVLCRHDAAVFTLASGTRLCQWGGRSGTRGAGAFQAVAGGRGVGPDRAVLRGFPSKFAHGAASGTVQAVHIHRLVAAPAAASSRDRVGVLVYPTRSGRLCDRPGMRHPGFSVSYPKHLAPLAARPLRFNAGGCLAACAGSIDQPETMREPCARQLRLARFAMRSSRSFPPPRP